MSFPEQTWHPVIPEISQETLMGLPAVQGAQLLRAREEAIQRERDDPHRHGYQPPMWRKVDLNVCEMRLENPLAVLEILIMGGIRSAKTEFAASHTAQHIINFQPYQMKGDFTSWVWSLHENERASETIAQARIYKYLPAELKTEKGSIKKSRVSKLNYTEGSGFTGEMFIVDKRLCDFKMYGAGESTLQGSELTMAWSDELVPKSVVATVRERLNTRSRDTGTAAHKAHVLDCQKTLLSGRALTPEQIAQLYLGVHVITFTPKEGYSATVADFLDGARTIEEEPAELLPIFGPPTDPQNPKSAPVVGYETVPRVKQCRRKSRRVMYFHTKDNPYGNWDGLKKDLADGKPDVIRITAYGDVRKAWAAKFPKFRDTVHILPLSAIPKKGTWYHVCDPCDTRNWFMTWWLVSGNRHYCVRQWPQAEDYIPGVGDPGVWALASEKQKADGDPGPAQESFGFGLQDYKKEIERVETELGKWFHAEDPRPITIAERHMDSRFGNTATPKADESTTLIEECEELGLYFEPAPGENLTEGVSLINDKLAYDETKPVTALNCPHLFVNENCEGVIYFLQNWTGKDGQKGACKDPGDTCRYHVLSRPEDLSGVDLLTRRGRAIS